MTRAQCVDTAPVSLVLTAAADAPDGTLELPFRTGAVCLYCAIPSAVFHHLIAASSKGAYFNPASRNRFRYHRVA